jgi:acetylornithine deacetylase/succinyl-diaminopimelate desuccinylase-like protein
VNAHEELFTRIDSLREAAAELLSELVQVNSVNPAFAGVSRAEVIGGETRCNEILHERYLGSGLECHWVAEDPERKNLVGLLRGEGGGRSLALNGHVDTVPPVEPESWVNGSPWNPEIREGRLYGIGSTDMKGSDVAMWLVAEALHQAGVRLEGDLHLHSVVGEETMQHDLGTSAVVRAGFRTDAAVVTEPTSVPRPLTISPVAAGNWYFRIVVEGKSTHCGNRAEAIRPGGPGDAIGVNALEKGVKIVTWLQELEQQWGMTKTHPYFMPGFFTILPGVFHADPGLDVPFYFSNRAEIAYTTWYPPQQEAEEVRAEIEDYVLALARLDPWLRDHPPRFSWLNNWPPASTAWEDPIVQTMVRAHEAASGERFPAPSPQHPVAFGAASDASFYEAAGIPSVVYGPGELRLAHCKDESVSLDELVAAAKGLAGCVLEWCGVANPEGGLDD